MESERLTSFSAFLEALGAILTVANERDQFRNRSNGYSQLFAVVCVEKVIGLVQNWWLWAAWVGDVRRLTLTLAIGILVVTKQNF